jgi:hypothetical protein
MLQMSDVLFVPTHGTDYCQLYLHTPPGAGARVRERGGEPESSQALR